MKFIAYDQNRRRKLFFLMTFCFFIRMGYQWYYLNILRFKMATSKHVIVDDYTQIAENLARGKGFSFEGRATATRSPLYPLVLALIYKIIGIWHGSALIFQAVCDTLSCLFIFLFADRLFNSYRHSLLAAWLWAVYIPGISLTVTLFSEPLFIAQLSFFFYYLLTTIDKPATRKWACLGLQLGLLYLCRPSALLLPLIIVLYLKLNILKDNKTFIKVATVMFFTFGLVISPWVIRNYIHSKRWIPGTTRLGFTLCESHELVGDKELVLSLDKLKQPDGVLHEYERDWIYRKHFYRKLKQDPSFFLVDAIQHMTFLYLHLNKEWRLSSFKSFFIIITNFLFLILACFSLGRYRGNWLKSFSPFWWILCYFHLVALFPSGLWRHNMPNIPLLIVLAIPALMEFLHLGSYKSDQQKF